MGVKIIIEILKIDLQLRKMEKIPDHYLSNLFRLELQAINLRDHWINPKYEMNFTLYRVLIMICCFLCSLYGDAINNYTMLKSFNMRICFKYFHFFFNILCIKSD